MKPPNIEVPCPIHDGRNTTIPGWGHSPDPDHPAVHSFTHEQAVVLLRDFAQNDWEDGPRCLVDVLAEIEKGE